MKTKTLRIWVVLVASLLAVGLPQQNAMGQTIRYGPDDVTLSALTLSGIEFPFSPYKRLYKVYANADLTATTVAATPNDPNATVRIYSGPPSATRSTANRGRGPQVALLEGYNYIRINVRSADGRFSQTYRIEVTRTTTPPSEGGIVNSPGSVLHGRTRQVADGIISALGSEVTQYNQVTNLAQLNSITNLSFGESESIYTTSLQTSDFEGLANLQTLNFDRNRLTSLPAGIFDKLVNLKQLDFIRNRLTTLPSGIFDKLVNLEGLYIDENRLTSLPAGIFDKLVNLKRLQLSANLLTSLPAGIFDKLVNLEYLNLEGNQLTTLPAGIFDELVKLQLLDLVDYDEDFDNWITSASAAAEIESLYEDDDFPHFRHVDVNFAATVSLTSSNVNIAEEGDDNNKAVVSVVANQIMFRGNVRPNHRLSVEYSTQDGTAIAGQDYTATSGTLTFQGNETNVVQTISIPILDDDVTNEPDETFTLTLILRPIQTYTPTRVFFLGGVSQLTATVTVTITDNDDPPTVLLSSPVNASVVAVAEGDDGTTNVEVPVQRIQASAIATSIRYATQDGTAIAGQDYTETSGTLTFPAGTTNLTQTISIPILGDTLDEPNEIFTVTLSDPTASVIEPKTVRIEILDDDDPAPRVNVGNSGGGVTPIIVPHLSQNGGSSSSSLMFQPTSLSLSESGSATYQVRATALPARDITTVNLATTHSGITLNPSKLMFTSLNWQDYQTVTVTASADAADTNEQASIQHSIPGSEGFIANNNAGIVTVAISHTIVEEEEETPEPPAANRQVVQQVQLPPTHRL